MCPAASLPSTAACLGRTVPVGPWCPVPGVGSLQGLRMDRHKGQEVRRQLRSKHGAPRQSGPTKVVAPGGSLTFHVHALTVTPNCGGDPPPTRPSHQLDPGWSHVLLLGCWHSPRSHADSSPMGGYGQTAQVVPGWDPLPEPHGLGEGLASA